MSAAAKIAKWVETKPILLASFDEGLSESLHESRQGFEHLTIVRPHWQFKDLKLPTVCILEIQEYGGLRCYLATATRKAAVSTFDTRLTIKKLRPISSSSFKEIEANVAEAQMKRRLSRRLPVDGGFSPLSPKLSSLLIEQLARDQENQVALDTALALLPRLRRTPQINWAQEDAIDTAIAAFGIQGNSIPEEVRLKRGSTSGLAQIGTYLYEDNVVHADASQLPGFETISQDITGRAVFKKRDERLIIYTANKLPLEQMLGVDLIYVNETKGNIVMVQYKMLEEAESEDETSDWLYRPDTQLREEVARMQLPAFQGDLTDYRLSRNPFYFKFVKRKVVEDSHQSFLVSLDHLNQILASPDARGPRGGIRLSYNALDGTYLREAEMVSLIRSGYIGTHRAETEALATIISEVSRGNKAMVLAWQSKVQDVAQ